MIPVSRPVLQGNELDYVRECIESGLISSFGAYLDRFEESWAAYCGKKHGVAVSNGTTALQVAVDALRLGPGDEVILPSFTIISCALAVIRSGATPILVDCDPDTFCMNVPEVEAAVTSRTRAIMPVHMYGHPVDMDPLMRLASTRGIAIIEDAAQAHGSEYLSRQSGRDAWRRCGSFGTISTFSFYSNKVITTGEGGMVLTDDEDLAGRSRSLRNLFFQEPRFEHSELGHNYRLTNLQAAIGVAQIELIAATLEKKRALAAAYNERLADVEGLKLPTQHEWARSNFWMYAVVLDDEAAMDAREFADLLRKRDVDTRPFFLGMHEQKAFKDLGLFTDARFPVTERVRRKGLYLPSGAGLSLEQIEIVSDAVRDLLA